MEGKPVSFLVDTGAQHSVLTQDGGTHQGKTTRVQGATGAKPYAWTTNRRVDLARGSVSHSFMVIPDSPTPLPGRDLLTKVGATISFLPHGIEVRNAKGQVLSEPRHQAVSDPC